MISIDKTEDTKQNKTRSRQIKHVQFNRNNQQTYSPKVETPKKKHENFTNPEIL